nr:MAG TPA: hypothetical protein [Bacteriophage sp.]
MSVKWVKIYQIWYIGGGFWGIFGVKVYILEHKWGCEVVFTRVVGGSHSVVQA